MFDVRPQHNDYLRHRSAQFRRQVERRLDGSLTEEEFRPLRLMNGVYLQLHAYMLRVPVFWKPPRNWRATWRNRTKSCKAWPGARAAP